MKKPTIPKTKTFSLKPWIEQQKGKKIILYAVTGMGKTTLAAMAPNPGFIGADEGGAEILHPETNKPLNYVPGIKTFKDVRDALHSNVFDSAETIVIDTITCVERWALDHTLATVPRPKSQGGGLAKNIHDYGYHEGFSHWRDAMLLLLSDFDRWVRQGKNVLLLAQEATIKWKTSGPEDFLMAGPSLHHSRTASTVLPYMEWADHIFRINYSGAIVEDGKIAPVTSRAIYIHPDATFFAKSRTIPIEYNVVEFAKPNDSSIWRLLFRGD